MLRLVWRENARAEAGAIFRYIAERNPAAADKLEAAVHACAGRLPERPYLYRSGRVPAHARRSSTRTTSSSTG